MREAVARAKTAGGLLTRYPGGFWCAGNYSQWDSFGTSTVEALVKRGVMKYCAWQDGKHGRFPIAAELTENVELRRCGATPRRSDDASTD